MGQVHSSSKRVCGVDTFNSQLAIYERLRILLDENPGLPVFFEGLSLNCIKSPFYGYSLLSGHSLIPEVEKQKKQLEKSINSGVYTDQELAGAKCPKLIVDICTDITHYLVSLKKGLPLPTSTDNNKALLALETIDYKIEAIEILSRWDFLDFRTKKSYLLKIFEALKNLFPSSATNIKIAQIYKNIGLIEQQVKALRQEDQNIEIIIKNYFHICYTIIIPQLSLGRVFLDREIFSTKTINSYLENANPKPSTLVVIYGRAHDFEKTFQEEYGLSIPYDFEYIPTPCELKSHTKDLKDIFCKRLIVEEKLKSCIEELQKKLLEKQLSDLIKEENFKTRRLGWIQKDLDKKVKKKRNRARSLHRNIISSGKKMGLKLDLETIAFILKDQIFPKDSHPSLDL